MQRPPSVLPPELDPRGPVLPSAHSRRTRLRRTLSWTAVIVSVLVLLISIGGYAAFNYYGGKLSRIPIAPGSDRPAEAEARALNFLIVGSDTRSAPGTADFNAPAGSADFVTGQRSDTVMLVHIPRGDAKATVVSFPRDSWVRVPAYRDDQQGPQPAQQAKLNAAFAWGGPSLLVQTVEGLTGLRIHHYVQVDFVGFQRMVDALGGVDVCLRTARSDPDSGDFLTAGNHHLNGEKALAFVRDRKGLAGGDFDRIRNQQYFLSVMLREVLSAGTLGNPFKLNAFLTAVTQATTVDQQLGFGEMRTLALRMRHLDPAHVTLTTLPNLGQGFQDGQSVVLVDSPKARALFAQLASDAPPKQPSPPKLSVPPSAVQVHVLNGSGVGGRGGAAAAALGDAGFVVVGTDNADRSDYAGSIVRYGPSRADAARTLAAAVPGATTQADSSLGDAVVLVVGADYTGVRPVSVGQPAPAAPRPGPTATPSSQTAAENNCAP